MSHDGSGAHAGERAEWGPLGADHSFALCLTHDVDRPYKTYQSLYYAVKHRDPDQFRDWWRGENPYWQFEHVMQLEDELGVRSSFNILNEQRLLRDKPIREWFSIDNWKLYAGRYSLDDPAIVDVIHDLDAGGWEIALHGSYDSYDDRERLRHEKETLERVVGHPITGGRQHYLNLNVPRTWKHHRAIGLQYDTTLGSNDSYGFQYGYGPYRPFDDAFVVFPLTVMEFTLPNVCTDPEGAWRELERLLEEARDHHAVMTALWHPRYFSDEHANYADLYYRLVERALEMDAWVGPPGELYASLDHPPDAAAQPAGLRQRRHA
ncbi:polysaccharide deacetylase family protein [Halorarius litoreus]|uniref:polysaccharide deacetylase family protein n=1 Tax=Halorarius litoreus TaxID=2962676 RepID=UPI0020CDE8D0|nr:polysaccharide deacetylase family protein [Halorarius litoreus]